MAPRSQKQKFAWRMLKRKILADERKVVEFEEDDDFCESSSSSSEEEMDLDDTDTPTARKLEKVLILSSRGITSR